MIVADLVRYLERADDDTRRDALIQQAFRDHKEN